MNRSKNFLPTVLIMAFIIFISPLNVFASVINVNTPETSSYYSRHEYLTKISGGYMRVFARDTDFVIQYFGDDFSYQSSRTLAFELPIFCGFYASDNGFYYVLTGQTNPNEDDTVEVLRLTKYDTSWNRIASAPLTSCNTISPAAQAAFTESGDYIFVHTCHTMYKSSDGLNHQANLSYTVNTNTMSVYYSRSYVSNVSTGYVSHSFAQAAEIDSDHVITVDHGDAYPRSFVLCRYDGSLSSGNPTSGGWYQSVSYIHVLQFAGSIGNNTTHASLGGLAVTQDGYLVAGTSADQSSYDNTDQNVFISFVPSDLSSSNIQWLTTDGVSTQYTAPRIISIDSDLVAAVWANTANGYVYLQYFHANGTPYGPARCTSGYINCTPVVSGNHLVWYSCDYTSTVTFHSESLPGEYIVDRPDESAALDATPSPMYRLYNPNSGEHFYTASGGEMEFLSSIGWNYEGIGWFAPTKSNTPVYRLYNPNAGDHHYTTSYGEAVYLVNVGWDYEGIGWYSDPNQTVPLYRQYNPNAVAGAHNFTANIGENDFLVSVGWRAEGIAWYGLASN